MKVDAAYSQHHLVLVGQSPGMAYGELGPTHHSIEDLAWLRTIPGLTVLVPTDSVDTDAAGVSARVIAMPTIKPLDGEALLAAAQETRGIVTVEESLTSGLGGAVAEYLAPRRPTPMRFVGVPDSFAPTGSVQWLLTHFGVTAEGLAATAQDLLGITSRSGRQAGT